MNLRHIEIFCAVMRGRTTVAAAFELGVSQPAISNAIKHMEARLGFALFERAGKRLIPTVEAETLFHDAQPLYAMSQAIAGKLRDLRDTKRGHFRLLVTHAIGRTLIPPVFARFMRGRDDVVAYFDERPMEGVVEAVETGFADLGMALVPARRPGLQIEPVIEGRMVVAVPRGHRLSHRASLAPSDLQGEPIIGLDPANRLGHMVRQAFENAAVAYVPRIEVRNGVTACALVEEGLGVAVVDEFSAAPSGGWRMDLLPFVPPLPVSVCVMTMKDKPVSRLAARFIAELRKYRSVAVQGSTELPESGSRMAPRAILRSAS